MWWYIIAGFMVLFGLLAWICVYMLWKKASLITSTKLNKIFYLLLIIILYPIGYFLIFVGLGIDHWDDSSKWYWDTWLLFSSTTALIISYSLMKLDRILRVIIPIITGLIFITVVLIYALWHFYLPKFF